MFKKKIKIPKELHPRLEGVAKRHEFESAEKLADFFIDKGLQQFTFLDRGAKLEAQLDQVMEERGYSSRDEVIEHLLLRGLRAYEENEHDPKKLEERLRGLGYIE
jgi:metal-responsive CopG/Arc/MetJ family transcriptional regulator